MQVVTIAIQIDGDPSRCLDLASMLAIDFSSVYNYLHDTFDRIHVP